MGILLLITAFSLAVAYPAMAAGPDTQPAAAARDPDYDNGRKAIESKNWTLALEHFGRAAARDPNNADIHNYLGYAHRKSGNLDAAFKSYGQALRIEPNHKGAHEYIGEAYLMVNNVAKAQEHLAALDRICFFSCEEYRDLKREIEEHRKRSAKR